MPKRMSLVLVGIAAIALVFPTSSACLAQDSSDRWDPLTRAVWITFKDSPQMIDRCAFKIAYEVKFDPHTDWPAYCNSFRDTEVVNRRVNEIRTALASLHATKAEKEKIKAGKIWVGATPAMAELAWGKPEKVNRTTTKSGSSEQWVYEDRPNYLYFVNGKLTAIQTHN